MNTHEFWILDNIKRPSIIKQLSMSPIIICSRHFITSITAQSLKIKYFSISPKAFIRIDFLAKIRETI